MMKPHSETLITHFVFPQLCFTTADETLWVDDPVEYVNAKIGKLFYNIWHRFFVKA